MRWITRRNIHVDRTSCPWLIRKFIDPQAEFIFVEASSDLASLNGHTFDMRGAEYAHEGERCTFQVMLERHGLTDDAALVEMGRIIRDADVPPSRTRRPEAGGLDALIRGFQLSVPGRPREARVDSARLRRAVRLLPGEGRRAASASGRAAPQTPLRQASRNAPGRRRRLILAAGATQAPSPFAAWSLAMVASAIFLEACVGYGHTALTLISHRT